MVEPPAPSVVVVESFHDVSGRTPPAGSRGKKLRNLGSRLPSVAAIIVSEGMGFLNSPLGLRRPVTRYPRAPARLICGGSWLPESINTESTVKLARKPAVSAGPVTIAVTYRP